MSLLVLADIFYVFELHFFNSHIQITHDFKYSNGRFPTFSDGCGGNFTSMLGSFSSPGYPGEYPKNTKCEYTIEVPFGNKIFLNVSDFHTERNFDYDRQNRLRSPMSGVF
jgi:hypothetical protein